MSFTQIRTICCIGAGYVGGPTMAVIADRCPHIQVVVVDQNKDRISAWNNPDLTKLPVFEPGLDEIVKRARGNNLHFSCDVKKAIQSADMIFISVNTPTKNKGLGAGQASDLKWVEACARQVAQFSVGHTIVVEKSTLPVRTAATIQAILEATSSQEALEANPSFSVLSNPEFLSEGTAINDLEKPDRVLIGGSDPNAIEALVSIYKQWVYPEKILITNLWSSELSKLIANAFLAQRISSINSTAALCEVTGANIQEVANAIGSDSRIGSKFLSSGPGFGGSCFQKDILNLVYLCGHFGLPEVANYWESVVKINNWQKKRIAKLIVDKLFGTVTGKKLAVLGFAFKANTNDTRESPAIKIAKDLLEEGATLAIYDPKVTKEQISLDLTQYPAFESKNNQDLPTNLAELDSNWMYCKSIVEAVRGADAILILTEWNHFTNIQWSEISPLMRKPSWVFDTRGIVNPKHVTKAGLMCWRVGDGSL